MLRATFAAVVSLFLFASSSSAELIKIARSEPPAASLVPAGPSVRDFGAKGDGKSDDTAPIQAAVNAAVGVVNFTKGDYRITRTIRVDLDAVGRTSLVGIGEATVIMDAPGPAFHIVGTHGGTGDPGSVKENVWQRQRMPLVAGIEIRGGHAEAVGLRLEKTMQATLTNLLVRKCKIGIHLPLRNRNLIIDHCHIYHNTHVGIDFDGVNLHQAIISNSHISYNRVAGIRLLGGEMRNFQIVGNDIEYNYDAKLKDCADILIDMTPEGSSFREGTIVGNTIQARPSPNGANIRILGGKGLKTGGLMAIAGNLIGSQTHNIHLKDCRGVTISGNSIYSAAAHSLWLEESANIVVANNSIDWNPDYKIKHLIDGVMIDRCSGVILANTIIEDSFQGSEQQGGAVDVRNSRDVSITNCQILDFKFRGIALTDSQRCRVSGCSILDRSRSPRKGASVVVAGGKDNLITDNIVDPAGLSIQEGTTRARNNIEAAGTG